MTRSPIALALLLALAGGCREAPETTPPAPSAQPAQPAEAAPVQAPEAPAEPAPAPAPPKPDDRQPSDFAKAWVDLRTVPREQNARPAAELRADWHGRIYTWTGYAVPGLCLDPSKSCALHVFERRSTPPEARLDGYFPKVDFTDAGYAALKAACKGKTGCVVTFRAVLSEAATDPDEPLVLRFSEAAFVAGRDPTDEEQWFGARADAPTVKKVPNAKLRTGEAVRSAIKVVPRTF